MKTLILALALTPLFTLNALAGATEAFTKMKTLVGEWRNIDDGPNGPVMKLSLQADESALLEEHYGMISVYHVAGDSILMTHYCSGKNQPRVRATDFSKSDELNFSFLDVTFSEPGEHYINGMKIKWINDDRIEEIWYSAAGGGKQEEHKFTFERVRK